MLNPAPAIGQHLVDGLAVDIDPALVAVVIEPNLLDLAGRVVPRLG